MQVLFPYWLYAVSATVKRPVVVYVWLGFCAVEVYVSPKLQDHAVGEFVEESVKVTANGTAPIVGVPEKAATGGLPTLM